MGAEDRYDVYFSEKIWELIPAVYRHEDGLDSNRNPGVLRALVEVIAAQAAHLRRDADRLWDDMFVELCDDWAVPYIGDLVATRLVSALNPRGRRIDVAKTIYYRRRKGTPRLLEELISDITGWDGVVVEYFRRLGRTPHRLDPRLAERDPFAGRYTGTPPGGLADLRRQRGSELAGGPFDEYYHSADVRRHRGHSGRHNIPKLGFHLYRLAAYRVVAATPFGLPDGKSFTFDPSGRDIPLFMRRNRPGDWDAWRPTREWELPAPMRCRVLGHAEYALTDAAILELRQQHGLSQAAAAELASLIGTRQRSESRLRATLATFTNALELLEPVMYAALLALTLVSDCGKSGLLPDAVQVTTGQPPVTVAPQLTTAGNLDDWSAAPAGKRLVIDPEAGRFRFVGAAPQEPVLVTYQYGFSGPVGAGPFDRLAVEDSEPDLHHTGGGALNAAAILNDGVTQIDDSRSYGPVSNKLAVRNLVLQAANRQRPYLRHEADWLLNTGANQDAVLVLDGLWLGTSGAVEVILRGDYERVEIRHCTFDPGGFDTDGNPIEPLILSIEGQVERMTIAGSILGPIRTQAGGVVEELHVSDSILQSRDGALPALSNDAGHVHMQRVTVFGEVDIHRLNASEVLITGTASVTDTQNGCFRFSAAAEGSRLPHPFESHRLSDSEHFFSSRLFGKPGYGQLSASAPDFLKRGAESSSEIGAFSALNQPIKADSLAKKVEEFMPLGLIPIFIYET